MFDKDAAGSRDIAGNKNSSIGDRKDLFPEITAANMVSTPLTRDRPGQERTIITCDVRSGTVTQIEAPVRQESQAKTSNIVGSTNAANFKISKC